MVIYEYFMKNVVLLYGRFSEIVAGRLVTDIPECNPNNENNWMGWTKQELEKRGYLVTCPVIPKVWKASYLEWKKVLDSIYINHETIFVGLSAGGAVCIKYILEENKTIDKLILVAPARYASKDDPCPTADEFYDFEISSQLQNKIKRGTTIFVSNDDQDLILDSVKIYERDLGTKVVRFDDRGHFSFLIKTFPELLAEILN